MPVARRTLKLVMLIVITFCLPAWAQKPDGETPGEKLHFTRDYSAFVGVLLPNQIEGVTEQTGMWGGRVGFLNRRNTWIEPGFFIANAWGVRYINGWVSYRYDVEVDSMTGHVYAGLDLHNATYNNSSGKQGGFTTAGAHVGGGLSAPIFDQGGLWFRTDMKFNLNPGTALLVMFSLAARFEEDGSAQGDQSR